MASRMVNPKIFEDLQTRVDQDSQIQKDLKETVSTLEKQGKSTHAILSRAHSTIPSEKVLSVTSSAEASIRNEIDTISRLAESASKHPYYKWNNIWSRHVQDTIFGILFCGWLGGFDGVDGEGKQGRLLTIEQVGAAMKVPVNLEDRDAFHITIEEYLQALISLIDELARLARNSVTLGDNLLPLKISQFIKDVHAGFQILNLKNDSLRRRSDGIKYRVKEVEDVVYDLSLRNLVPNEP
ncbi:putative Translin-1 [Pseudovirgaria hyperparasitica]|uniref:Putative Translin-1 n=1 Tax=Pseudovirgaria hyperparasitica TaxID=470096 RepID=A0A6A6WKJ6_9PEZI|nr:putative Translin-1 [Pseudovirgaria hyperparasitica]KAF2762683.1 putative Translin-1 [Pseudovirgaria hyperparasitica]